MQLRYFGLDGLRTRIQEHIDWAQELAERVDREPDAERLAPAPFSTVCLRWRPREYFGRETEPQVASFLDDLNERILAALNETGEGFLSNTRLSGRFALRVAIGSLHTERRHVDRCWQLIRELGAELAGAL